MHLTYFLMLGWILICIGISKPFIPLVLPEGTWWPLFPVAADSETVSGPPTVSTTPHSEGKQVLHQRWTMRNRHMTCYKIRLSAVRQNEWQFVWVLLYCIESKNNSNIGSRWVHRESNLMFILSNDKDQRNKFAFVQCKLIFTMQQWSLK